MTLSPDDVVNVAFPKPPIGQRGYDQAEVDDFLDRIEAALRHPDQHTLTRRAGFHDRISNRAPRRPRVPRG